MTRPHLVSRTNNVEMRFKNKKEVEAKINYMDGYEQVMLNSFLKDGNNMFGYLGVMSWLVQQDNDTSC